jgi:translation initiation factor 5B
LKKFSHKLNSEELKVLNEIVEIQRKINPVYGY